MFQWGRVLKLPTPMINAPLISVREIRLMRGERRRRCVNPHEVEAWCSGRWGPRRARVTECSAVLQAESLYTELLRNGPEHVRPGRRCALNWTLPGRQVSIEVEVVANAVWRFGRVFLRCPKCGRRATRIYVPASDTSPACRLCWGLTYILTTASKLQGWGPSGFGRFDLFSLGLFSG